MGQLRSVLLALLTFTPLTMFSISPPPSLSPVSTFPSLLCLWVTQLASRRFCPGLFLDVMLWKRKRKRIILKTKGERKRDISPRLKDLGNLNRFIWGKFKKKSVSKKGTVCHQGDINRRTHGDIKKSSNPRTIPHLPHSASGSHWLHYSEPTAACSPIDNWTW